MGAPPSGSLRVLVLGASSEELEALRVAVGQVGAVVAVQSADDMVAAAVDAGVVVVFVAGAGDVGKAVARVAEVAPGVTLFEVGAGTHELDRALFGRLVRAELRARAVASAADDFASLMSHELRGHLSTIGLARDVLAVKLQGGEGTRQIDAIGRAVARGCNLLDQLREMVAIERFGLTLTVAPIDGRDVVQAAVADVVEALEKRGVQLRIDAPADEVALVGDCGRLVQAVGELVKIAARHARKGSIVVSLERRGPELVYAVWADDLAIDEGQHACVFERTWRGPQGVGTLEFGAAMARTIAHGHGGWVAVRSFENGSCLELGLPGIASSGGGEPHNEAV